MAWTVLYAFPFRGSRLQFLHKKKRGFLLPFLISFVFSIVSSYFYFGAIRGPRDFFGTAGRVTGSIIAAGKEIAGERNDSGTERVCIIFDLLLQTGHSAFIFIHVRIDALSNT
jgi:hypothetical protein